MIQIDRNIPIEGFKPSRAAFPFAEMETGDSFAMPKTAKGAKHISAAARAWAVQKGYPDRKFSMRTNGETVRIWRVS